MSYVVTDACIWCRAKSCLPVCPVECFYGDGQQTWIHPGECIDCGACEPECPSAAIRFTDDPADPDLVENTRQSAVAAPLKTGDPPVAFGPSQHRDARDVLLVEIARAAAAADRESLARAAEEWFPAIPMMGDSPRPFDPGTPREIFRLLRDSYPDRWVGLLDHGRSLLVARPWPRQSPRGDD